MVVRMIDGGMYDAKPLCIGMEKRGERHVANPPNAIGDSGSRFGEQCGAIRMCALLRFPDTSYKLKARRLNGSTTVSD